MYLNQTDRRIPLERGAVIAMTDGTRYVIDGLLGRGGMALVYLAHAEGTGRFAALKEFFPHAAEFCVAERRADGRIVVYDPFSETPETVGEECDPALMSCFLREIEMAREAGVLYRDDGGLLTQNHPDLLQVEGPLTDTCGNVYLAIDTMGGESLAAIIESGWETPEDKGRYPNSRLEQVIRLLILTARRLSQLHSEAGLLHLDLSPANIYVSRFAGETEPIPFIIDYASAYDPAAREGERSCCRYTSNAFSAPEILSLSALRDPDCGYHPDRTSDTYALAAILFYTLLGRRWTAEDAINVFWQDNLYSMYPTEVYGEFTSRMIEFLCRGLAPGQSDRYRTADTFGNALEAVQQALDGKGWLCRVPRDEQMAMLLCDRYPLYDYADGAGNMDVLCLGGGAFMDRLIKTMMSCGQMIGRSLRIHIAAQNADACREALFADAPELRKYAALDDAPAPEYSYVRLTFETMDVLAEDSCQRLLDRYAAPGCFCRYVVISLGENRRNAEMARRYAGALAGLPALGRAVIHYAHEDIANNTRGASDCAAPEGITLNAFDNAASAFAKSLYHLGIRAAALNYSYAQTYNPEKSWSEVMAEYIGRAYDQRSSAASALHLAYKMMSLGIDPRCETAESLTARWTELHQAHRGELIELEHRRWMMQQIADGRTMPTFADMQQYGYAETGKGFNAGFKFLSTKAPDGVNPPKAGEINFHHCLTPCGTRGLCLPADPAGWDCYRTEAEIDASPYDPLDRVSLKAHLIAGMKIRQAKAYRVFARLIELYLIRRIPDASAVGAELRGAAQQLAEALETLEPGEPIAPVKRLLDETGQRFAAAGIAPGSVMTLIGNELSVYKEYADYHDYKASDARIAEDLLPLWFAPGRMQSRTAASTIQ